MSFRNVAAAVLVLAGCAGEDAPARQVAEADSLDGDESEVPAGRLPEGTTYDFGGARGGAAEVGGAHFIGRSDAPVTVATFGDFECQFCARSAKATARAREELLQAGTIRILYLDFPLPMHSRSEAAAEFARCVGRVQGGHAFWQAYQALHETQDRWTRTKTAADGFRTVAEELGVPWPDTRACMESDAERPAIERFRRLGQRVGVRGTPTTFFNGRARMGAITGEQFRELVDRARANGR